MRNGLYPRPWKRSLMFAPPANRSRALFTLSVRDDDRVDLWCAAEAFQTFYALEPGRGRAPARVRRADDAASGRDRGARRPARRADGRCRGGGGRAQAHGRRGTGATSTSRSATAHGRTRSATGSSPPAAATIYTKPLEKLFPGARVFLYKPYPVKGYVGVGIVKEKARPVTEFEVEVDGQRLPILEAPLADPEKLRHDADDPELREHLVRVEWLKTRPLDEAAWQTGLFTNQMPACKLRDRETIEYLEQAFELDSATNEQVPAPAEASV